MTWEEQVNAVIKGVKSFADEMREQGIHVGIGTGSGVYCANCAEPWPCPQSGRPS